MEQDNSNIPVVPKFYWNCELFCAGEKYGIGRTEITQDQAKAIFSILKTNSRWLLPKPKAEQEPTGKVRKNSKVIQRGKKKKEPQT